MGLYRKKPVEVEAVRWTGNNWPEVVSFLQTDANGLQLVRHDPDAHSLLITTLEGRMRCSQGDWLIRDEGGYYPCWDKGFRATYETINPVLTD